MDDPVAVEKFRFRTLIELATIDDPTAEEKASNSLLNVLDCESNTLMVDPVAVEKFRFRTLM